MTVNTLTIELTCNGKTLKMGPGQDIVCRCTNEFRQFIQRALSSSVSFQSGEGMDW